MSLLSDIKGRFAKWVLNHYEGAIRYSRDRGWIRGWVQDARFDATSATRFELVRKARHFERNDGIATRMGELFQQFTVGANGLVITPASSDKEWNKAAGDVFTVWSRFADIAGRNSFQALQAVAAVRLFHDGEVFFVKKYEKIGRKFYPRLHMLETQRVATPPDMWGRPQVNIHDGVEVDDFGRPVAYYVRDDYMGERYTRFEASDVIHIFDQERPGQLRGLPFLTPVMNELQDLEELERLTMRIAKKHASIAAIFKTRNSTLPADQIRSARLAANVTLNNGTTIQEDRIKNVQDTYGGDIIGLYPDESIEQPKGETPTAATREHWDYLVSKVCCIGIPKLLVFPHSMQGTVARADLDTANAWFRARSQPLQDAFIRIRNWVIDWESFTNPAIAVKPFDWVRVNVRPPRSVNADVGRNSKAMIDELRTGVRTYEGCVAELGGDWRETLEQRAVEAAYIKELAEKYDIPANAIAEIEAMAEPDPVAVPAMEPATQ